MQILSEKDRRSRIAPMQADIARWAKLAKERNITLEN